MSSDRVSRAAFGATLADVLTAINAAPELWRHRLLRAAGQHGLGQRQGLQPACRACCAKAFSRSPELVAADPALLGRRLAEISPVAHGIAERRWANDIAPIRFQVPGQAGVAQGGPKRFQVGDPHTVGRDPASGRPARGGAGDGPPAGLGVDPAHRVDRAPATCRRAKSASRWSATRSWSSSGSS
jgi:hypothetical protein